MTWADRVRDAGASPASDHARRSWRPTALTAAIVVGLTCAAGLWLSAGMPARQLTPEQDEKQIRQAAFRYYAGMVLGDETMCVEAVGFPFYSVRNGSGTLRDEKSLRSIVAEVNRRRQSAKLTDDERKRIAANVLIVFDQASIQFIGGDTASVVFVVRPAPNRQTGDVLAQLVLHRRADKWRVIAEFTDSKPAPPLSAEPPSPADGSSEQRP